MALQLNDATALITRTTNLVAASSNYSCCFWFQPAFELGAVADYIAPFALINAGYTAWAGIFSDNTTSPQTYEINTSNGGAPVSTTNHRIPATRKIWLAYTRSGTTHNFFANGLLVDDVTLNIAAVTFATMLLGNDGLSVVDAPLMVWDFKEWNVAKSIATLKAEMRSVGAVVSTAGLVTYTPLVGDLQDDSGNGNDWSGAGNFSFVTQPTLPSNLSPATATTLSFLPTAFTIEQSLDASEVTIPVFYKYQNATALAQVLSLGHWGNFSGYGVLGDGYITEDLDNSNIYDGFEDGSSTFPLPAGQTMWFLFESADGLLTPFVAATLHIKTLLGPAGSAQSGDVFIRSASYAAGPDLDEHTPPYTGLPAGFIRAEESEIVGFIPMFITGESGDVLPTSGRLLFADEGGSYDGFTTVDGDFAYWFYLFEPEADTIITRVAFPSPTLVPINRTHLPTEKFYLLGRFPSGVQKYATVDAAGTLSPISALTTSGAYAGGFAVNVAETILYLGHTAVNSTIKRWDLVNGGYLSDLAATVANYSITDMLGLEDDTILALYYKSTVARDMFVRHYSAAGALLDTYTFTFSATLASTAPRMGYASDADPAFWVFNHLTSDYSDIRLVRVSDGVELVVSLTPDINQSANAQEDPPIPYTSDSCPIVELRAVSAEGSAVIGPLIWVHWPRRVIT